MPEDDKSDERPILASEAKRLDKLLTRANYLGDRKNDSCVIVATEALRLSRANNAPRFEARAMDVLGSYYYNSEQYKTALDYFRPLLNLYAQLGDSAQKA